MKIHLISLNQDYEKFYQDYLNDTNYDPLGEYIRGQIYATEHLLSVAEDILNNDYQGKGY